MVIRECLGRNVDLGAAEAQWAPAANPPLLTSPVRGPDGAFGFNFTSGSVADFTVLSSTNAPIRTRPISRNASTAWSRRKSWPLIAFSPDGQMLTAYDGDNGFSCWRVPTLAEIDAAEAKQIAASREP